jgi:hypothetical protein
MAYIEWRRGEGVVACRLDRSKIPTGDRVAGVAADGQGTGRPETVVVDPDGLIRKGVKAVKNLGGTSPALEKGVFVEMGSRALFFVNGRYEGELAQGAYRLDKIERILEKHLHVYHPVVVLMDAAETWIDFEVRGKRTKDLQGADVFLQLALQLTEPELFLGNVMKGADAFSETDLRVRLFQPLAQAIEQFVASRDGADLALITDEIRDLMLRVLQGSCRDVLAAMGFDLVRINVFTTDVALDNVRKENAAHRARERAETADVHEQLEVDAEKAALQLRSTREAYQQRKAQGDLETGIEIEEAETTLATDVVKDDLKVRRSLHELDVVKGRIDMWARFADETLRKEVLEKSHVLELEEQLDKVAQEYRQLGVIRDEEWRKFQDEVNWSRLQDDWDRQDRLADRSTKEEEQRKQRKHILGLLDMKLAKELQKTQLQDSSDITRLKLELARGQIEEKLELDKVDERAKQDLSQVLFEGRRDELARIQQESETRLDYEGRLADMKRALGRDSLNHEAEVNDLRANILLTAVDREEAQSLLDQVIRRAEAEQLDHELAMETNRYQAAIGKRKAESAAVRDDTVEDAGVAREIKLAAAKAEMDAEVYAAEARHRAELLVLERKKLSSHNDMDELERLAGIKSKQKEHKVALVGQLAKIDMEIQAQEDQHVYAMKEMHLAHESGLKRLDHDLEIARIQQEREIEIGRQGVEKHVATEEKEMTADQIEARRGMENARVADYQSRGNQRDTAREKEIAERDRKETREREEQARKDGIRREDAIREDARSLAARDERIMGTVAGEVRQAAQGAVARERDERTRDAAGAREHKDDVRGAYREGLDAVAGVKRESVAEQRRVEHHTHVNHGDPACPHCAARLAVSQGLCPNCGGELS